MQRPKTVRSLRQGFASRLRLSLFLAVVGSTVAFGYLSYDLLKAKQSLEVLDRAKLCAASIEPDKNGAVTRKIERLKTRYPRLLAAATLSTRGRIVSISPELPSYRVMAKDAMSGEEAVSCSDRTILGQVSQHVCATTISLNGDSSSSARRVLFIFASESVMPMATRFAAWAGFCALIAIGLTNRSTRQWFNKSVIHLVNDVTAMSRRAARAEATTDLRLTRCQAWRETAVLGESVCNLVRDLNIAEARVRRIERDTQWELQERQAGFDKQLRRAKDQAMIDPLTKLRNRRFLEKELERLVAAEQVRKEDLSVAMIDLDHFKTHNDSFGHEAGDEILAFVGELLRGALRPSDHAVRYGGDEFLLLLPDTNADDARRIVDRVAKLFNQYLRASGKDTPLSMSAGVASLDSERTGDAASLITRADAALYEAKRLGKNNVTVG